MEDDFVVRRPPKSTGRDRFGPQWVDEHVPHPTERSMEQVLASLSLFTARSVVVNCQQFLDLEGVSRIVVSGGGVHHRTVMTMLTQEFSPVEVTSSARFGVDPDIKEALGFAILAAAFLKEIPGNAPSVTGASRPVVLGKLTV
ncbi:MAG: anhydro-N-acetylmuramic acid kinase [Fidelibacterota bacterium]